MKQVETIIVLALVALSSAQIPNRQNNDPPKGGLNDNVDIAVDSEDNLNPVNPFDPDVCMKSGNVAVCTDCNKISVCLNGRSLPEKECPTESPYCVGSEFGSYCSGQPDPDRDQCQDKFQCTSDGYFPDPNDCHYFYVCDSSLKAFKYDCMPGYVYDVNTHNCKRQMSATDCRKLDCTKSNGVWTYYGTNRQYYGYCYQTETGSNEVALFKCSDGAEFDGFQCKFKCKTEGKFADSQSPNRFIECYYVGYTLVSRVKNCVGGMVFDDRSKYCRPQ